MSAFTITMDNKFFINDYDRFTNEQVKQINEYNQLPPLERCQNFDAIRSIIEEVTGE